jgi:hypothetical protein
MCKGKRDHGPRRNGEHLAQEAHRNERGMKLLELCLIALSWSSTP